MAVAARLYFITNIHNGRTTLTLELYKINLPSYYASVTLAALNFLLFLGSCSMSKVTF